MWVVSGLMSMQKTNFLYDRRDRYQIMIESIFGYLYTFYVFVQVKMHLRKESCIFHALQFLHLKLSLKITSGKVKSTEIDIFVYFHYFYMFTLMQVHFLWIGCACKICISIRMLYNFYTWNFRRKHIEFYDKWVPVLCGLPEI